MLHVKIEFHKFELQNSSRLLNISQIVINCKIFRPTVIFDHFGLVHK